MAVMMMTIVSQHEKSATAQDNTQDVHIFNEGSVELNETNFPWTIMREHIRMD